MVSSSILAFLAQAHIYDTHGEYAPQDAHLSPSGTGDIQQHALSTRQASGKEGVQRGVVSTQAGETMEQDKQQQDKQRIIDKVRKLQQLQQSANEHEAMLAMQLAQEILEKHNLTLTEIHAQDTNTMTDFTLPTGRSTCTHPIRYCAAGMAYAHDIEIWFSKKQNQVNLTFFGHRHDVQLAVRMYCIIEAAMHMELEGYKHSAAYCGTKGEKKQQTISFLRGMAHRLNQRFYELKQQPHNETTAIVHVKRNAVRKELRERGVYFTPLRDSNPSDNRAYAHGMQAGDKVGLGHNQIRA